MKGSSKELK
jgi:hypothetical protein